MADFKNGSEPTDKHSERQSVGPTAWEWICKVIYAVLDVLFRLVHKELKEEQFHAFMQFVKFSIVGVSNTLISYVTYVVGLLVFRRFHWFGKQDYLIAQVLAFIISVAWSFYWNNRFVFTLQEGEHRSLWRALIKTYIS